MHDSCILTGVPHWFSFNWLLIVLHVSCILLILHWT